MFGTVSGDEEAVKTLEKILENVAPGWELRGFKGDFLDTAVLVEGDGQIEDKKENLACR